MPKVGYIIIGQGIAGTMLSYSLLKAGKTVMVVDRNDGNSTSLAAGGIINPVTGRRTVTTWKIDELLPCAKTAYHEMEELLGISILTEMPIHKYFSHPADRDALTDVKLKSLTEYVSILNSPDPLIIQEYGGIEIHQTCRVDGWTLLPAWREYLKEKDCFLENEFDSGDLKLEGSTVTYKDIEAKRVVFCEGAGMKKNPWFKGLPLEPAKGEALVIEMDGMPQDRIIQKGVTLLPIGGNQFYVGSTNEWDFTDELPSETKRKELEEGIAKMTALPYKVIRHMASARPGVKNRRPLIGVHQQFLQLAVFNGMGTKGYSLSPWCAKMFVEHLEHGGLLDKEVDIKRFG